MNNVVSNVRDIIRDKGYKQCVVAEKAGFSPQDFSNMLCGRKVFKVEYVVSICKALEISPNDLFDMEAEDEEVL